MIAVVQVVEGKIKIIECLDYELKDVKGYTLRDLNGSKVVFRSNDETDYTQTRLYQARKWVAENVKQELIDKDLEESLIDEGLLPIGERYRKFLKKEDLS